MHEGVGWECLSSSERNAGGGEELAREFIAVNNAENTMVHIKISTNGKILPGVVVSRSVRDFARGLGDNVTLEENTLGDSSVFNARLNNVHSIILEVIEYDALTEAVVLVGIFHDGFLEVSIELEHLLAEKTVRSVSKSKAMVSENKAILIWVVPSIII